MPTCRGLVREDKGIVLEVERKLEGFSILQTKIVFPKDKCPSVKCCQRQRRKGMEKDHWICRTVISRDRPEISQWIEMGA